MMRSVVVVLCVLSHAAARRRPLGFGSFQLPKLENPFDERPGATVGKLQVALANEDMVATKIVAEAAETFERDRSRRALPNFISTVATALCRQGDAWLYAACSGERFDPGRVERDDHERAYFKLVDTEAAKFEVERTPSTDELERTRSGVRGMCVVSIVVVLEGDLTTVFEGAADSEQKMRDALTDLGGACLVRGGDALYNAEVLWTPSSADEALFKDEALVDFPELMAL